MATSEVDIPNTVLGTAMNRVEIAANSYSLATTTHSE